MARQFESGESGNPEHIKVTWPFFHADVCPCLQIWGLTQDILQIIYI